VLEEAGIRCGKVTYAMSQPWPFPSSLMIGCHAQALSETIVIDRSEIEDARWFSRDELAAMLGRRHPDGLTTPPPVAIAHHLIRSFVEDGCQVLDRQCP
jgi:NAD+ diphosphatase